MLKTEQFLVAPGVKFWGIIHLPDDYDTNAEECALLCFGHGTGEKGSTQADSARLLDPGPLYFANLGNKMIFKNPVTGKDVRFIIVAIQDPSWSPSAAEWDYCLRNDILVRYTKINKNCISTTGLSAGGQETLTSITTNVFLNSYCAAVPMSPANSGNLGNINATAAAKIRSWGFSGNQDGSFTQNLQAFTSKLNSVANGYAREIIYQGAHGGWNAFYNPDYRNNIWGAQLNIYEFILACTKGQTWVPSPPPGNTVIANINIPDGSVITGLSVVVSGIDSINAGTSYDAYEWSIKPTGNSGWDVNFEGGIFGQTRKVINLTNGVTYNLSLKVKNGSNSNVKTIQIKCDTSGGTTPPPVQKKLVNVVSDVKDGGLHATLIYNDSTKQEFQ